MVLVTGGTGFLGAYLICDLLKKGKQVRALKRAKSSLDQFEFIAGFQLGEDRTQLLSQLEWVEGDINSIPSLQEAYQNITEVYHCGAVVSFTPHNRKEMMQANVDGTANMVNLALDQGVRKFCHVSSIAAIGRTRSGEHIDEKNLWVRSSNNSQYAISKHQAEMEVWRATEEGLNAVIVNPGIILGAGDWTKGTCHFFPMVDKGMWYYTEGVNGYVDVRDVSQSMIQLMESDIQKERFILVSENISFKYSFDKMAQGLGKKEPSFNVPRSLAEIGWRLLLFWSWISGKQPVITKETTQAAYSRYYYSNKKIQEAIGFSFRPIDNTISDAAAIYKSVQS